MSPARSSNKRAREMYDLYTTGATLGQVGDRFGLTAERVRQIFLEADLHIRSLAETHALRHERLIREKGDDIATAFAACQDTNEVARQLDVPQSLVKEIVNSRLPAHKRHRPRKPTPPKYPTDEMMAFLREAATTANGQLSLGEYRRYAEDRRTSDGRTWPSIHTYISRFGSWRKALKQAGLPVNRHAPEGPKPRFSEEDCIEALREAARRLGQAPTLTAYDQLARTSAGRLPGALTVKHRLGSWHSALTRANL